MKLDSVLVTGANRGIGLEFVRQLVRLQYPPSHVFATYRSREGVQALKTIRDSPETKSTVLLIKVDVTKKDDLESAKKIIEDVVGSRGLTLLINNAGVVQPQPFPELTEENLNFHFSINTVAPIMTLQVMLPLLQAAAARGRRNEMSFSKAAVLNMSSMAGCITNTGVTFVQDLDVPGYKISKAALNMAMRVAAAKVKQDDILVVSMCPGWVKTDMGTDQGQLEPEESIADMLKTVAVLNETHHGSYMDRLGNPYQF